MAQAQLPSGSVGVQPVLLPDAGGARAWEQAAQPQPAMHPAAVEMGTRYLRHDHGAACDACDACASDCDACASDCESCPSCLPMCPDYRGPEPCFDCIKPWGGLVMGAEATFLKPHDNLGVGISGETADGTGFADVEFGYELAPRVWLGYMQVDGLGFRLRWWEFDHTAQGPASGPLFVPDGADACAVNYDTYVIDAEFTDTRNVADKWYLQATGGFRYVNYSQNYIPTAGGARLLDIDGNPLGTNIDFSGEGLTGSLTVRRMVRSWASLFLTGRASVVMGDATVYANGEMDGLHTQIRQTDVLRYMWEGQMGGEVHLSTVGGSRLFARGALEVQNWDGFNSDAAVGFSGFTAGVGMER